MTRSRIAILALSVLLIASNTWWLHKSIDAGLSRTYLQASLDTAERQARLLQAVLRESIRPDATKASIVAAAQRVSQGPEPFDKDGHVWIGEVGLKFDDRGKMAGVATDAAEVEAAR